MRGPARRLSAADAEISQRRVAGALASAGLRTGDRVAFLVPSSPELLLALLGALRSGVVAVPLNPALLPEERTALLADAEPGLVVDDDAGLAELLQGPEAELAPAPLSRPMHYTSGTTGRPKGVWSGVLSPDDSAALLAEEAAVWNFGPDDVHLVCSPLHHSVAIRFSAGTLLAGGSVVVLPRFEARAAIAAIAEYRPTTAFMVPAHLQRLFAAGDLPDLSSLRLLVHAGAPCPQPLKEQAIEAFPVGSVWEFYGSTEGQFTVCSTDEWFTHPGSVGRARPGRRLSVDADGMIWCAVPPYARFEYWRDAEKTAAAWRGDAFTVGDLGRLDDDGYLFLDGRRDDLVISGGVNVYPAEVERVLSQLPTVRDVAVFGVDDERWGQRVCAAIVGDATPEDVLAHARAHLAPYKVPKEVHVVEELPHTSTGKLRRGAVASQLGLEG
ncbi:MAG: AMP-binding protein [Actinobacteria bacterium]|nr:AMP-binding protein [Actinomycetota bacterium]